MCIYRAQVKLLYFLRVVKLDSVWSSLDGHERDLHSRSSSEFVRWRIRKVSSDSPHFFILLFGFTGRVVGLVGLSLSSF